MARKDWTKDRLIRKNVNRLTTAYGMSCMLSQKGQGSSEMENDRFMVTQILIKAMDVINFKLQDKQVTNPKEVADLVRLLRSSYSPLMSRTTGPTYLRVSKDEHDGEPLLLLSQRRGPGLMDAMAKIIQGRLERPHRSFRPAG